MTTNRPQCEMGWAGRRGGFDRCNAYATHRGGHQRSGGWTGNVCGAHLAGLTWVEVLEKRESPP